MLLNVQEFQRTRELLLGTDIEVLCAAMARLQFGETPDDLPKDVCDLLADLGWVAPGTLDLSERGWFAADCCREYHFWSERNHKLPFATEAPDIARDAFRGKSVLEVGSGSGTNLMSLNETTQEIVGLEPLGIYRQIGSIFAEAHGITDYHVRAGSAEAIPFPDARFDVVICVTSHQYFNIAPALIEIARVLRPDGEAIVIGCTLRPYLWGRLRSVLGGSLRGVRSHLVAAINSVSYMVLRRRVLVGQSKWTTAYPVYPSRNTICTMLQEAGLQVEDVRSIYPETCFRARKIAPAAS
jgi:SAM-dependent methyltransferase